MDGDGSARAAVGARGFEQEVENKRVLTRDPPCVTPQWANNIIVTSSLVSLVITRTSSLGHHHDVIRLTEV